MIGEAGCRAPDLIDRVVGYRDFEVAARKRRFRTTCSFCGPFSGGKGWEPGVNVAVCHPRDKRAQPAHQTAAPDRACACGLYGYYEIPAQDQAPGDHVVALCTFWGRIIPHETGLRAEFAEIHAVAPWAWQGVRATVLLAAEDYGVEVFPHPGDLGGAAEQHGRPLPVEMRPVPEPSTRAAALSSAYALPTGATPDRKVHDPSKRARCSVCDKPFATRAGRDEHFAAKHRQLPGAVGITLPST